MLAGAHMPEYMYVEVDPATHISGVRTDEDMRRDAIVDALTDSEAGGRIDPTPVLVPNPSQADVLRTQSYASAATMLPGPSGTHVPPGADVLRFLASQAPQTARATPSIGTPRQDVSNRRSVARTPMSARGFKSTASLKSARHPRRSVNAKSSHVSQQHTYATHMLQAAPRTVYPVRPLPEAPDVVGGSSGGTTDAAPQRTPVGGTAMGTARSHHAEPAGSGTLPPTLVLASTSRASAEQPGSAPLPSPVVTGEGSQTPRPLAVPGCDDRSSPPAPRPVSTTRLMQLHMDPPLTRAQSLAKVISSKMEQHTRLQRARHERQSAKLTYQRHRDKRGYHRSVPRLDVSEVPHSRDGFVGDSLAVGLSMNSRRRRQQGPLPHEATVDILASHMYVSTVR